MKSNWVRRSRLFLTLAVATTNAPTIVIAQNLNPLEKVLNTAGYQLYNPPRANWGPGFVFTGTVKNGRISNIDVICKNLYVNSKNPEATTVILASYEADDSFSFSLAAEWLKGLLGQSAPQASASLDAKNNVSINFSKIQEYYYAREDAWLENKEERPINSACRSAINDLKQKKKFEGQVFVIVRAVAADSLKYDFGENVSAAVEAQAKLPKTAGASLKTAGTSNKNTQLEINQRLYIGYAPPKLITDWLPSNEISGEIVAVKAVPTSLGIE